MEQYYCIDLSFPKIDFEQYFSNSEPTPSVLHSHLYIRENEIELRILFDSSVYFDLKFSAWLSSINSRKFGKYIQVSAIRPNQSLINISFVDSQVIGVTSGTAQYEGNLQYYSIKLNTVKLFLQPIKEKLNTGDFYLSPNGFKVVSGFYSTMFKSNDCFEIPRYNVKSDFYNIESATFRPEFEFGYSDSIKNDTATIKKIPKIHFIYNGTNEVRNFLYSEIVKYILSFYFHFEVEYSVSKLYLKDYTIYIKRVYQDKNNYKNSQCLYGLGNKWDLDSFLKSDWQKKALINHKKLHKAVELFNQSHLVDFNSRFLIWFNIVEVCMGGNKSTDPKFRKVVSDDQAKFKYNEALNLLLETVSEVDAADYRNKWNGIIKKMDFKPINSPLETFLKQQGLQTEEFSIKVSKLKEIRDNITHGSIKKVKITELESANIFLSKLCGILILNLLGIKEWVLTQN